MHTPTSKQTVNTPGKSTARSEAKTSHAKKGNGRVESTQADESVDEYRKEMDVMIGRTARTVRRLLEAVGGSPDERTVDNAEIALSKLRARIKHEGMRHQMRNEELARLRSMLATTDDTQSRIDQAIIDARVTAGDLGMTRDALARDVVRAKRALGALDREDSSEDTPLHASTAPDDAANLFNRDASRRQSSSRISTEELTGVALAPLHRELNDEIKNLKVAELRLVDVVDEINRVKKIRADLRRKMKDAEREW